MFVLRFFVGEGFHALPVVISSFTQTYGEPPARVPHRKTVHRTVFLPLLRFLKKRRFRSLRTATGALPLDPAAF